MKNHLMTVFFILVIFSLNVKINSKKAKTNINKSKKKNIKKNNNSINHIPLADAIRPSDISRELFCDACQAIIIESIKNLRNLYKESDVIFYLTNGICSQKNFEGYHFSKPEMEIACEVFISEYYDEIEKVLMERNPKIDRKEKIIQKLCFDKIKACNGVELENIRPIKSQIINGELYDIENVEEIYQVYPKIEEVNFGEDMLKENNKSEL